MNIILEGLDASGKSTIGKLLKNYQYIDPYHTKNEPLSTNKKDIDGYAYQLRGSLIFATNVLCSLNKVVIDRLHLSEYVYSKYYNRESYIDFSKIDNLICNNTMILYCYASYETSLNRFKERNEEIPDENTYNTQIELYNEILVKTKLKTLHINTDNTIEHTKETLENLL